MTKTLIPQKSNYRLSDRDTLLHGAQSQQSGGYVLRVRDMPSDERPRERLLELGAAELSTAELLAVVWALAVSQRMY